MFISILSLIQTNTRPKFMCILSTMKVLHKQMCKYENYKLY